MKIPWAEMLCAAAARGAPPEVFWRLSLREWRMLAEGAPRARPMTRKDLERMAEAWPDD